MTNDKESREKVQVEAKVEDRGQRLEAGGWRRKGKFHRIVVLDKSRRYMYYKYSEKNVLGGVL
jgi:hypothetical protein